MLQVTIPFEEKPTSNLPGDNLRYYRQRKSLTTRQLAEQIDVVPATILMYEQNKHPIPFDVANSLADALDVNADLLYDDFAVFLVTPYSEALKDIRMSIGMSQRAFAEHIGVIPSYYYKLESGHRRPSRKVYQRMVDTLSHTHPHHSLFAQHKSEVLVHRNNMTAFFLDYLNTKVDGFAKEEDAYEVFKDVYRKGKYTNESMLKEILHYADFYHAFLYGDKKYGDKINSLLRSLQKLKQTTVFLFLFPVFDDYENEVIGLKELEKVLQFLLHYSIRRLICEIGSNSLRGLYKTLYARVFARTENKQHYYDAIVSFFQQLTSKDALPDDKTFILALKQNNLYRKNALCKFLLTAIENQGKEQLITDNLTIEHIMPQNKNLSTAWQKMLGEDVWQSVQEKYLHTLGNLTLTAYNSELGDKPFDVKQKELDDVKTKVVVLYSDVKGRTVWNAEAIELRADRLADIIVKLYPIEQPAQTISFADPRYKEYTCDDPDNATYKAPNYYVLQGERVNTTNFAEMLRSIVSRLYELDSSIIEEMARNNERLLSWSQNVVFSYDVNEVYGDYKLGDTDIYESTGFSAAHIMYIIRALLDKYDIEWSDFAYSARSTKPSGKEEQ